MRRYALRDDQWDRIKDLLPGRAGYVGVTAKDNRLFVEAVLYRYRAGIPWRDLPERFGAWKKVHTRFCRWARGGVWERVFRHLAGEADNEYAMIDSRVPFVGDAGLHSKANLAGLAEGAGRYVLATPLARVKEIRDAVLGHPGRYAAITPELEAKEVVIGEGERRRRYVVWLNR